MSFLENLSISQFEILEELGKGGFGTVYRARKKGREKNKDVALKEISNKSGVRVNDEINALKKLNEGGGCSRIVKFYGSFFDENNTYIVMEYCKEGSLRNYILKKLRRPLLFEIASDVLNKLIEGVTFMHKRKVMHRDLTPANILITTILENGFLCVKIADFGLTKEVPKKPSHQTCVGTPGYIAGEVHNRGAYDQTADVYSLGGILYIMLCGKDPSPSVVFDDDGYPVFKDQCFKSIYDEDAKCLIKMMMSKPEKRIKLNDIVKSEFMRLFFRQKLGVPLASFERRSQNSINSASENFSNRGTSDATSLGQNNNNDNRRQISQKQAYLLQQQQKAPFYNNSGKTLLKRRVISNDSAFESEEKENIRRRSTSNCQHRDVPEGRKCSCGHIVGGVNCLNRRPSCASLPTDSTNFNKFTIQNLPLQQKYLNRRQPSGLTAASAPSTMQTALKSKPIITKNSKIETPILISNTTTSELGKRLLNNIVWPLPYVHHLYGFKRLNKYGRFVILSNDEKKPSMVYEMIGNDGFVNFVYHVRFNFIPHKQQRVTVYQAKREQIICDVNEGYCKLEPNYLFYLRSADDVCAAPFEVKSGYQKMGGFINMARNKTVRCKMKDAFGYPNYNLEMRYDGTILLSTPKGIFVERTSKGNFLNLENLSNSEKALLHCACLRLLKIHESVIAEEEELKKCKLDENCYLRIKLLNKPFDITNVVAKTS